MPMPSRSQFANSRTFIEAINAWAAREEAAYQRLLEMFNVASECDASFCIDGKKYQHVWAETRPDDIEPMLRNLASSIEHSGDTIKRVCHGNYMGGWAVIAELQDD